MIGKSKRKRVVGSILWSNKRQKDKDQTSSWVSQPSLYHALIVIFLEFFAWGLLTSPIITVLNKTFPNHTLLMNGLIQGIKGMLSFLSAPLVGALSDVMGRKPFLILTVSFTCAPIPLMMISPWWYFAMISLSGVCAVTFSIVFAYVADVTPEDERSAAYGLVSATFAASLITSPAIGAYLGSIYSDTLVVWLASAIAVLDIIFIVGLVPESLPEKVRPAFKMSLDHVDPFVALRKIGQDHLILLLCITVFLSYLPEAGEYSCFFVYLRLIMGFSPEEVASFIAVVGVLSVVSQTVILALLMKYIGHKQAIMFGLLFEIIQLTCYGFGSERWIMWAAGAIAAMSSITYPAISSFVSAHAEADQQGVAQGVITGIRGLCTGLGPALYGLIFYLFDVHLNDTPDPDSQDIDSNAHPPKIVNESRDRHNGSLMREIVPGPPFAFGAILVILALLVSAWLPENPHSSGIKVPRRAQSSSVEKATHSHSKYESEPLIMEENETT